MSETAIGKIVVGLDGSDDSARALEWSIRMARGMGAHVVAVHVIDVPPTYAAPVGLPLQADPQWHAEMTAVFECAWCSPLREAGIPYEVVLEPGRPAEVLSGVAHRMGADIVVVGRHGIGGIHKELPGSVSAELARTCCVPVLTIPRPETQRAEAEAAGRERLAAV